MSPNPCPGCPWLSSLQLQKEPSSPPVDFHTPTQPTLTLVDSFICPDRLYLYRLFCGVEVLVFTEGVTRVVISAKAMTVALVLSQGVTGVLISANAVTVALALSKVVTGCSSLSKP